LVARHKQGLLKTLFCGQCRLPSSPRLRRRWEALRPSAFRRASVSAVDSV
jgi:hypothetical protein